MGLAVQRWMYGRHSLFDFNFHLHNQYYAVYQVVDILLRVMYVTHSSTAKILYVCSIT